MKREELENKDQELIKKFRTIIHNKEKKPAPKTFPFGLIFLFTALIIFSLLLLKQQSSSLFSKAPETISRARIVPVSAEQHASTPAIVEKKALPDAPKVLAPLQKTVARETILKSSDSVLSTPVLEQDSPVESSNQGVQGDMPSGIRIEEIISCSSVVDMQCSSPKIQFSLGQEATPTIWMKVVSQNPSFTLTHVYYLNEQKYCEIPLAIRYHQMRTWSSITLRSPDHIGKWRVEVIADKGAKLDQVEFIVVK
ncbi:MAG: DUF2914 domain-containing protein [Proteobacteria bacterium]|nr:DUF2914 domain-containing protein [Desulfobacula sp.]MBU3952798.1 DUF2914 domain-containing protein [Pseudomonadota bacterium]MBU4132248.1 DUF2914 domain-containing protein [Pseudomonadota bacterium]